MWSGVTRKLPREPTSHSVCCSRLQLTHGFFSSPILASPHIARLDVLQMQSLAGTRSFLGAVRNCHCPQMHHAVLEEASPGRLRHDPRGPCSQQHTTCNLAHVAFIPLAPRLRFLTCFLTPLLSLPRSLLSSWSYRPSSQVIGHPKLMRVPLPGNPQAKRVRTKLFVLDAFEEGMVSKALTGGACVAQTP